MKRIFLLSIFTIYTGLANAALFEDLRELRGTLGEVTRTTREVNVLSKEAAPAKPAADQASLSSEIKSGDILVAKVANVKVLKEANKKSAKLAQVSKSDELIYMGEEQNGLYLVTAPDGEGWVDKILVKRR
ncbi:MAG: hypothetical protein WC009_01475 [Methylotenera sp.]